MLLMTIFDLLGSDSENLKTIEFKCQTLLSLIRNLDYKKRITFTPLSLEV